jgi:cytosine/adenosine deaminase-related metal-dependent hydrolase
LSKRHDGKGHTVNSSSKLMLIRGGVLIDGTGADPAEDGTILIEGGKIVEVRISSNTSLDRR